VTGLAPTRVSGGAEAGAGDPPVCGEHAAR
jgi:hypothetical protein